MVGTGGGNTTESFSSGESFLGVIGVLIGEEVAGRGKGKSTSIAEKLLF